MIVSNKLYSVIGKAILIIYLVLFPMGQLLKFGFNINLGNLSDVVVLLSVPFYFFKGVRKPKIEKGILFFIISAVFSLFLSLFYFNKVTIFYGSLYLVRLFSYYAFGVLTYNLIRNKTLTSQKVLTLLVLAVFVISITGWFQYLFIPNLTFLKYINWDDHLYRLGGTFFDPGFTGIILILGTLTSLDLYFVTKNKYFVFVSLILLVSVFFTYSRASFLGLFGGLTVYFFNSQKKARIIIPVFVLFVTMVFFLPKLQGEGNNLLRTQSINARFSNYEQTLQIIKKYPLFGVGFNNLCATRHMLFNEKINNHSCSGSDSSLLFIAATTGSVGLMIFISLIFEVFKNISATRYKSVLFGAFTSIVIHSLFVQSMFYPFVLGFLAILLGSVWKLGGKTNAE